MDKQKSKHAILGINVSHNASAALMVENEIVACFQEERLTNKKSFFGYPKKSIDCCLNYANDLNTVIKKAVFTTKQLPLFALKFPIGHFFNIEDFINFYGENYYGKKLSGLSTKNYLNYLEKDKRNKIDLYLPIKRIDRKSYFNFNKTLEIKKKYFKKQKNNKIEDIKFLDHHSCHVAYAFYSAKKRLKNSAIVTLDSEGDGLNQTVWISDDKYNIRKISESSQCDIARIYKLTTLALKMKPDEHEYKVMGMAPYAKNSFSQNVFNKTYKNLLKVSGTNIKHYKRPKDLFKYILNMTNGERFDNIAGGVQIFVEEIVKKLFLNIHKKYKVKNFYLSGGVSMNIKMNKILKDLKFVKNLIVQPSGGDESLSMGGCFLTQKKYSKPINNIYLGRDLFDGYSEKKFLKVLKKNKNLKLIKNFSNAKVAKLLSSGNIIAVARGREEFGARALGNRSILADPSNVDAIQIINDSIKNRDFWMPFAITIMDKYQKQYLINNKNNISEYMTIGFDSNINKYKNIIAGTHRYDKSVRPQILTRKSNENYYSLIKNFYKYKKIPALLNTSLNLHGYPLASTIKEVLSTFINSKLKYLYVNDYYLIVKKKI